MGGYLNSVQLASEREAWWLFVLLATRVISFVLQYLCMSFVPPPVCCKGASPYDSNERDVDAVLRFGNRLGASAWISAETLVRF